MSALLVAQSPAERAKAMIRMSEAEADRLRVLEQVFRGEMSRSQAAMLLGVSTRQLRRIERRYKAEGAAGLVHLLRGRSSNRKLDASLVVHAQQLILRAYRPAPHKPRDGSSAPIRRCKTA